MILNLIEDLLVGLDVICELSCFSLLDLTSSSFSVPVNVRLCFKLNGFLNR